MKGIIKMYSIKNLSRMFNVSETTIRYWDKTGKLKAIRDCSNRRVYNEEDVEKFIKENNINISNTIIMNNGISISKGNYINTSNDKDIYTVILYKRKKEDNEIQSDIDLEIEDRTKAIIDKFNIENKYIVFNILSMDITIDMIIFLCKNNVNKVITYTSRELKDELYSNFIKPMMDKLNITVDIFIEQFKDVFTI